MKKVIRATRNIERAEARAIINQYSKDQIDIVNECIDEENALISRYYTNEEEFIDQPVGPELSEIRKDYASAAMEEDLLDPDQWDELYNALSVFRTEDAMAYA